MTHTERVYTLHRMLSHKRRRSLRELLVALECSRATFARIKCYMTTRLRAPLEYHRAGRVYYYSDTGGEPFELPSLWLTSKELAALVTLDSMLQQIEPGILKEALEVARERISSLQQVGVIERKALAKRIKLLPATGRPVAPELYMTVAGALVDRRRLSFIYDSGELAGTSRTVSPQTLVRYRDTWYLDAHCHNQDRLRTFALCGMSAPRCEPASAQSVAQAALDEHFAQSYGLFAGPASHVAVVRFSGTAARYVSREVWHPKQQGRWVGDVYELRIPFGDSRELIGDILRWGAMAEVVEPAELRDEMRKRLVAASLLYER